ncbi:GFA family protein [Alteromonas sp. ASW11-130]|uniref:GFA family protein n=1 Tax=Alteromonas sp. ASW11-130 TaxID=3015775 RepID=UPI0022427B1D|nr:GFA family protein [Alteromonas sp. ASW11-130]MCW8093410.1 GFA family protein [Alteromonas sp. ASW11-130]
MTEQSKQAHCLCNAVSLSIADPISELHICHCSTCRQWGGGPMMVANCGTKVSFKGEPYIVRYHSSEWAERGFCKQCGTHLFYHYLESGSYFIPAGLMQLGDNVTMASQIFIDEKPHYYEFSNDTVKMTGAEVIAQYSNE